MREGSAFKVAIVLGTRPEAIKLAPVILAMREAPEIECTILCTGQHRELLDQTLSIFALRPDVDLALMQSDQSPVGFSARALEAIALQLRTEPPDLVVVQGDTSTALAGALAAFLSRIPVAHVEAGLRSGSLDHPFPEEGYRRLISQIASLHFAPTKANRRNLLEGGIAPESVHVTGNPGLDALRLIRQRKAGGGGTADSAGRRFILVTLHRRESFGSVLSEICHCIAGLAAEFPDREFVYPVHPNPAVREVVFPILGGISGVRLMEPIDYVAFVHMMADAELIVTDSGGVQEEAPSLQTPVLVLRDATERPEVVDIGAARLVGRDSADIRRHVRELLTDPSAYDAMRNHPNPYGDGHSAQTITAITLTYLRERRSAKLPTG